ncbi:hypothetical protein [Rhodanobacter lindaniclasticus]
MNNALKARFHDHSTARSTSRGKSLRTLLASSSALLALALCSPAFAHNAPWKKCGNHQLNGRYVFTASGFTRAPAAPPGSPWVPKAILEVLQFNGNGGVLTPAITAANPFGDLEHHAAAQRRGRRVHGQRRLHRQRALPRRERRGVHDLRRIVRRHHPHDSDQPLQQRVRGHRAARR